MDWHVTTDVTHVAVANGGEHVITLRRTSRRLPDNVEFVGPWRGQITNGSGIVTMTAEDESQGKVVAACQAWLQALSVARERDPVT